MLLRKDIFKCKAYISKWRVIRETASVKYTITETKETIPSICIRSTVSARSDSAEAGELAEESVHQSRGDPGELAYGKAIKQLYALDLSTEHMHLVTAARQLVKNTRSNSGCA